MTGVTLKLVDHLDVEANAAGGGPDLQVDGEYAGQGAARFRILPDAVTLLVPRRWSER
jgi:diacylglycerol kinase family enzyme